jgi:anti-sigma regulatory factor (Ser/Thr protein kinase)
MTLQFETHQDGRMTHPTAVVPFGEASDAGPGHTQSRSTRLWTSCVTALPSGVTVTRRLLAQLFRLWGLDALSDTAQLVASELMTNAVTASGACLIDGSPPQIELSVRRTDVSVIVEVRDANPARPGLQQPDPMDEAGRGLFLVAVLGSRWGHYAADGGGKVVWCEMDVTGRPRPQLRLSSVVVTRCRRR